MERREEWIAKRAYALWEQEGQPPGRDHLHWEQASRERDALEHSAASADGGEVTARPKRRSPAKAAVPAAPTAKKTTRKKTV